METKEEEAKIRKYKLLLGKDFIFKEYLDIWGLLEEKTGKYVYIKYKKDDKYYVQLNDKIYGPYDYVYFTLTKDNKAIIAYILGDEIVIEEIK
ncbi:MAG: hypothetical protein KatS3mg094_452 [Candidatus Parcubacteria bacterium]|nr:MAG: hypothetical protein KatS3mg094_452 [Candidatus Parcubacteria bacterium]